MQKILTVFAALGAATLSAISATQPARALEVWSTAGWFAGATVVPAFGYAPGYGAPYYPYEWSYGYRVGYGYPYGYNRRFANPLAYGYIYRPYGTPAFYDSTYAWAGPPCYIEWARYGGAWRKARICD